MLRILTVSSLYPNSKMPNFGVFVENRICRLCMTGEVKAQVIAPVPWLPLVLKRFADDSRWAEIPQQEERHGIPIDHPRYIMVPKIGMHMQASSLAFTLRRHLKHLRSAGKDFDLIDAHFFYPDGVAAVRVARMLGKPVIVTARGSDINLYTRDFPRIRQRIVEAARHADGVVAVSVALKEKMVALGVPAHSIIVLRNGVDLQQFQPLERAPLRTAYNVERTCLVSVGNLVSNKGHDVIIRAMPALPNCELLIVGDGPERLALEDLRAQCNVCDRVRFLGAVPHQRMREIYNLADLLVLATEREGWPNVLLEAMACGTPVVATAVGGIPEIMTAAAAGRMVKTRSVEGFVEAICKTLADGLERKAVRCHAEAYDWGSTTRGQLDLFRAVLARRSMLNKTGVPCPATS